MKSRRLISRMWKNIKEPMAAEVIFKSSASPPPWVELPKDVTANILQRLGAEEILKSAQHVCTTWREVCRDPSMWRVIDLDCRYEMDEEEYDRMCRCAVDLSQRQLIDLRITCFGDDELLSFVADRSSHLQNLTLENCPYISGYHLAEAVKKLPHLQELHLIMVPDTEARDIEAIAISCPMLKSFTFNGHWDEEPTNWNEYSFLIAKNMPNLRHLRLGSHWMRNKELEAILDGCPHLESLDISECFGFDLQGALGKRCCKQITTLAISAEQEAVLIRADLASLRAEFAEWRDICCKKMPTLPFRSGASLPSNSTSAGEQSVQEMLPLLRAELASVRALFAKLRDIVSALPECESR